KREQWRTLAERAPDSATAGRVYGQAQRFAHGQRISDLIAGYDAVIVEGPVIEDPRPGAAIARYGRDQVRLQQVVWPDRQGRFPWEDGYDVDPHAQPLIAHPSPLPDSPSTAAVWGRTPARPAPPLRVRHRFA